MININDLTLVDYKKISELSLRFFVFNRNLKTKNKDEYTQLELDYIKTHWNTIDYIGNNKFINK